MKELAGLPPGPLVTAREDPAAARAVAEGMLRLIGGVEEMEKYFLALSEIAIEVHSLFSIAGS